MNGPMKHSLTGTVANRESGLRIVEMFNGNAKLIDKPAGMVVVIAATPKYLSALRELDTLIKANGNMVTPEIIAQAKATPSRKPRPASPS